VKPIPIGQLLVHQGAFYRQPESSRLEIDFCEPQTTDFVQRMQVKDSASPNRAQF
jgi:hypothetical protein